MVAGDLTLSSVRSFLREAVPGCEEDSTTSCLIVDDMLNLVYDRETFKNPSNSPRFLGRTQDNTEDIHRQVVRYHENRVDYQFKMTVPPPPPPPPQNSIKVFSLILYDEFH